MRRNIPFDICFVLDVTRSNRKLFTSIVDHVSDLAIELLIRYRRAAIQYGAVIYRDPVDYKRSPISAPIPKDILDQINEFETKLKQERIEKLKAADLYDKEIEAEREEISKHYDREKYPVNENVAIPFNDDFEHLREELMKVECDGGDDDPEDWVGALKLALDGLEWRKKSKKLIIWIADANAHGKKYCGYDNHNEEEPKLQPLVERMAKEGIYFIGTNLMKGEDEGCGLTLQKMKEIYENSGGKIFIIDEFKIENCNDYFDIDDWPQSILDNTGKRRISPISYLGLDFDL